MDTRQIGRIKADDFKIHTGCPFHLDYSIISNLCYFCIGTEKAAKLAVFAQMLKNRSHDIFNTIFIAFVQKPKIIYHTVVLWGKVKPCIGEGFSKTVISFSDGTVAKGKV